MKEQIVFPVCGFMLLPPSPVDGYRGIDRNPFVPTLLDSEMDEHAKPKPPYVWSFYGPGWRRDAFKLYEENMVGGTDDNLDILRDCEMAKEIRRIIEPHAGVHEIVACEITTIDRISPAELQHNPDFLGYDVAYLGGDFFSAIRAGVFGHRLFRGKPNPRLQAEWKPRLNQFGLLTAPDQISDYVRHFKEEALSEKNSDFYIWAMALET
jgi:hypothetical protein